MVRAAGDGARRPSHLGLGATLSTTFHTAYHLARWLASLDVMSKGRVAWNVVTSATDLEARNFGMDELPPKDLRYDRADEVLEACFALWDSWDDGAFVLDKEEGVFADPSQGPLRRTTQGHRSARAGRCPSRAARRAGRSSCRPAPPIAAATSPRAGRR